MDGDSQGNARSKGQACSGGSKAEASGHQAHADPLCSSPRATRTKGHKWGGSQQKSSHNTLVKQYTVFGDYSSPGAGRAMLPLKPVGEPFFGSFKLPVVRWHSLVLLGLWMHPSPQSSAFTQCSSCACLHMHASYMGTSYIGRGAHRTPAGPHLN